MTALVKLKECEDTHLGEEVDRNWAEVVTQQYVFDRLNREVRTSHAQTGQTAARSLIMQPDHGCLFSVLFLLISLALFIMHSVFSTFSHKNTRVCVPNKIYDANSLPATFLMFHLLKYALCLSCQGSRL